MQVGLDYRNPYLSPFQEFQVQINSFFSEVGTIPFHPLSCISKVRFMAAWLHGCIVLLLSIPHKLSQCPPLKTKQKIDKEFTPPATVGVHLLHEK